jgi:hypothetical protein
LTHLAHLLEFEQLAAGIRAKVVSRMLLRRFRARVRASQTRALYGEDSMVRYGIAALAALFPLALHAQRPQVWTLQPVASIGGAQADDGRYHFDRVRTEGIAGRANGNLLVLDVHGKRLLEYDARGRHARTWGREGDGPGELRFPTAVTVGAADSAWVFDVGRVSIYPANDQTARTIRLDTRTFGMARVSGSGFLRALAPTPSQGVGAGAGFFVPTQMQIARFDGPAVADTVWRGPVPAQVVVEVRSGNNSSSTTATEQYGVTTHWDQLGDGTLVVADSSAYVLRLVTPAGRVLRTFGTLEAARRTTAADRERAFDRIRAANARRSPDTQLPPELWRKVLEQTPFSPVIPRIAGVRVDPQDRIWVGVSGELRDLDRIDVYDRNGTLIARIADPPGMPAVLYGTGLAALLEHDEYDAQLVRIMRVTGSDR